MLNPGAFEDRREMQTRLMAMRVISIFCFILLASAFWILQVVQHDKYGPWADKNYLRTIPLRAPRGVLFDRTGRVLVDNQDSDTITFLRERTANMNEAIRILAEAVGLDEARVREPIQRAIARRDPPFRPIPIVEHATKAQVVAEISTMTEIEKKIVAKTLDALNDLVSKELNALDSGEFVVPGLVKLRVVEKKATEERQGINPHTREPMVIAAKPASKTVRASVLKALKDQVQ